MKTIKDLKEGDEVRIKNTNIAEGGWKVYFKQAGPYTIDVVAKKDGIEREASLLEEEIEIIQ